MKIQTLAVAVLLTSLAGCGGQVAERRAALSADRVQAATEPTPYATPDGVVPITYRQEKAPREHLTQPIALPSCPGTGHSPHFTTPEAAMTYLAAAWNRGDLDALCHVTNPNARFLLNDMHSEANHLRLQRCRAGALDGMLLCVFTHGYPASMHKHGIGHAYFDVGPADTPGWYMTVYEGCGG
ncbi:MAG: hypothetical protein QOF18_185 [Frankiaceae bacterium]|jgi:hypothetical protein|nr:hypothetical protein [Frankiaceae bacterium]